MNFKTLWNNHKIKIMLSLSIFINQMDIRAERERAERHSNDASKSVKLKFDDDIRKIEI